MTNYLVLLRWHNRRICPYPKCSKVFKDGIVLTEVKGGEVRGWFPDGQFLFHYYDAHGMPPEVMTERLTELVNSKMSQKEIDTYNRIMKNKMD